jgi:hypothetical protein
MTLPEPIGGSCGTCGTRPPNPVCPACQVLKCPGCGRTLEGERCLYCEPEVSEDHLDKALFLLTHVSATLKLLEKYEWSIANVQVKATIGLRELREAVKHLEQVKVGEGT